MAYTYFKIGGMNLSMGSSYQKILLKTINISKGDNYASSMIYKVYGIIDYFKFKVIVEDSFGNILKSYDEFSDKVLTDIIKTISEMYILKEKDDKK